MDNLLPAKLWFANDLPSVEVALGGRLFGVMGGGWCDLLLEPFRFGDAGLGYHTLESAGLEGLSGLIRGAPLISLRMASASLDVSGVVLPCPPA